MRTNKTVMGGKVFCVGVTGHRPNRMPEQQWPRIRQELAKVMGEIEAANPGRRLVLMSGLAEGADRLAAFVALGRGWSLWAVLAFHRTRFEEDFPEPHAIGEFRALLAASDTVDEPGKTAHLRKPPEEGYHAVGQKLLAQSKMLIAVWDGEGSRGKGGTVDVIEDARARGVPVVWVHAKKAQAPRTLAAATGAKSTKRTRKREARPAAARHVSRSIDSGGK